LNLQEICILFLIVFIYFVKLPTDARLIDTPCQYDDNINIQSIFITDCI